MDILLLKSHAPPNPLITKPSSSFSHPQPARIFIPLLQKPRKTFGLKMSLPSQNLYKNRVEWKKSTLIELIAATEKFESGYLEVDFAAPQKKVVITNKHGEKLVGILHESGTTDIIILCHGFQSSKEAQAIANFAAALENAGISSFRFDFAGNGESEGSFQYGNYWREVEDLHAVAQHFSGEKRAVRAIVGHSKGGNLVLLYASKYHDIKTVVNISGRYDPKTGVEERLGKDFMERIKKDGFIDVCNKSGNFLYRVTEESLMDRLNTNMHEACLQIENGCRVLTVHGSADKIVGVESAYEFAKIIPNHKLHIIKGANHSFSEHQDELASVVVNFIKESFHQDKAPTPTST